MCEVHRNSDFKSILSTDRHVEARDVHLWWYTIICEIIRAVF